MHCDLLLLLGVHFGKDDLRMFVRQFFIGRREGSTGAAPGRPEIDDHEIIVGNGLLEGIFVQVYDGHGGYPVDEFKLKLYQ